ncbi:MAG: nickel-dependent lactate racemase [Deltaproteobacteria bacterium]|nr:nickel-dependent lactate racemase [Deltaproteobacteria bacterium]
MGLKKFSLRFGKGSVKFQIPEEDVLYEIVGNNRPALSDLPGTYRHALDHPIDAPPLQEIVKPKDTLAITVSDITRAWQRNSDTLGLLVDYLNRAGVPDQNITVLIAVGAHRQNTAAEFAEICGQEVCHRVRVVNHDARDTANMVYLGKTSRGTEVALNRLVLEADKVILTGGVIYHYMVGYGGGRKSVLPGVAALKTIQQNHLWGLGPTLGSGPSPLCANKITKGNPQHEDMMEIAAFLKPDFMVNVVPNFEGGITGVFAGNWVSAWQEATVLVDQIYGVMIQEKADMVIASAGGYPKDINLYQSQKTLDNARYAIKPGGVAVILAECPDITEPREFFEWFKYPNAFEHEKALRENFELPGWVALRQAEHCRDYQVLLLTRPENADYARQARVQPVFSMDEALKLAYQKCGIARPKITVMPFGANTYPIFAEN